MGFEAVAAVLPREIEEMPGEAILVPVTVAEGVEPCVEGTPLIGDTVFRVAPPFLDVLVDSVVLLDVSTLSNSFLLFVLRCVVPVPDVTVGGAFSSLR